MHLGKQDLNQNEAEWIQNYAKDLLSQACHKVTSDLNKKCTEDDVKDLLHFIWSKSPTVVSNEEAEAEEIYAAEVDSDNDE